MTKKQFRKRVVQTCFFPPTTLSLALKRMGFVQADPIRCPARAQDLILRQRVKNYRAGDLERLYPKLDLEECFLFAYGFAGKELWKLIHPKTKNDHSASQTEVLEFVRRSGTIHPKELEEQLGSGSSRNYWGGSSRTSKMTLESLHNRGDLRVAHREKGIRVYEISEPFDPSLSKEERFEQIMIATLKAMGATTRKFLLSSLSHFRYLNESPLGRRKSLEKLIHQGRIRVDEVGSEEYVSLVSRASGRSIPDQVRILAPFDPLVRDRARFEHLWNWTYRFEAYTPLAKRKLGYYAMPVVWRDVIVGWANTKVEKGILKVEMGYALSRPKEKSFQTAAEEEVTKLATFLGLKESNYKLSF